MWAIDPGYIELKSESMVVLELYFDCHDKVDICKEIRIWLWYIVTLIIDIHDKLCVIILVFRIYLAIISGC